MVTLASSVFCSSRLRLLVLTTIWRVPPEPTTAGRIGYRLTSVRERRLGLLGRNRGARDRQLELATALELDAVVESAHDEAEDADCDQDQRRQIPAAPGADEVEFASRPGRDDGRPTSALALLVLRRAFEPVAPQPARPRCLPSEPGAHPRARWCRSPLARSARPSRTGNPPRPHLAALAATDLRRRLRPHRAARPAPPSGPTTTPPARGAHGADVRASPPVRPAESRRPARRSGR